MTDFQVSGWRFDEQEDFLLESDGGFVSRLNLLPVSIINVSLNNIIV